MRKNTSSIISKDLETNTVSVPYICYTSENKFGRNRRMQTSSSKMPCLRCEHLFLRASELLQRMKIHM